MTPVQALLQALYRPVPTSGKIIIVQHPKYYVTTAQGPLWCTSAINTPLNVNDAVALSGTVINAKLQPEDKIPHYIVS